MELRALTARQIRVKFMSILPTYAKFLDTYAMNLGN